MKTLYFGGTIETMTENGACEALLTEDGLILATGSFSELSKQYDDTVARQNLHGATLLPGFLDAHGHLLQLAGSMRCVALGGCTSPEEIARLLREQLTQDAEEWVIGFGYDNNLLPDFRHPTQKMLDEISTTRPIVITHISGHLGVMNHAALRHVEVAEMDADCGFLTETSFQKALSFIPPITWDSWEIFLKKAQETYLSYGVTTAQEGLVRPADYEILQRAASQQLFQLDLVGYCDVIADWQSRPACEHYVNHFRIGGDKLFLDGSPQGRTAWLLEPYLHSNGTISKDYGVRLHKNEDVVRIVKLSQKYHRQLLTHANGDAAIRQLLDAYKTPSETNDVLIHAQLMRPEWLQEVKEKCLIPSFFVAHTFYWGDMHLQNLGWNRAANISPVASASRLGIPFTLHQDAPVLAPNPLEAVLCAAKRTTQSGRSLNTDEAVPARIGMLGITRNAAIQYREANTKGTLEFGKRADFVILDKNPLRFDKCDIFDFHVLKTIKDGQIVWQKRKDE